MISFEQKEDHVRPYWRRFGFYLPVIAIGGFAAILLVYLSAMRVLGWELPFIGKTEEGLPVLIGGRQSGSDDIYLYISKGTQSQLERSGGRYEVLLTPWRNYFQIRQRTYKEIHDPITLESLGQGTLILPSAIALDDQERVAIKQFKARGGSVLATWASGSRNGAGDWVGWDFLGELCCAVKGEVTPDMGLTHLIPNGESPVALSLGAGLRVWMDKRAENHLRLVPSRPGAKTAARLMNWARTPNADRLEEAAVVFHEESTNAGRVVVYAFSESSWESSPDALHMLVDDSLNWLSHKPALVLASWPNGKRAAQLIAMDTEEGFPNALNLAEMMQSGGYKGTFFLLSSVAKQYPEIAKSLSRNFDIGYHGDIHVGFKGTPVEEQSRRINEMRQELALALPAMTKPGGFRAPTESYDATTEAVLYQQGFLYHAADPSSTDHRLPFSQKIDKVPPQRSLIVIPRTQRDDINFLRENVSASDLSLALDQDLAITLENEGLGYLSLHSQHFTPDGSFTAIIPEYLAKLVKHENLWLTSGEGIADWWKNRERVKINARVVSARIDLDITVIDSLPVKGASLTVMLPAKGKLPKVQEYKVGMPAPRVVSIDDYRASIIFDELNPGSYSYQVVFNR